MTNNWTIKDIAERAGVGTTTVSRVLNDHPYVSTEKREKVLAAIDELDYRPNYNARRLRGLKSGLVGFLTDEVATTPFAVDIIRGAQNAAYEDDCVLLVMNTGPDLKSAEAAVEFLLERQVAGIVYAAMFHRAVELPENIYQVPTALANCYVADRSLPSAVPDEEGGGYHATRALIEAGHRRIALLQTLPPAVEAAKGRLAGHRRALAEFGIPLDSELLGTVEDDPKDNYETMRRFLALPNPPTAISAGTDRAAMACYSAILTAGLRIPDDVAVIGFDNQTSIAENLIPALTTVQLPHYKMGAWAFHQLFADNTQSEQVKIDCPLVIRHSV